MIKKGESIIFKPSYWLLLFNIIPIIILTCGILYSKENAILWKILFYCLLIFYSIGVIDFVMSKIRITKEDIKILENFKSRIFYIKDIINVKKEDGRVLVELFEGKFIKFPIWANSNKVKYEIQKRIKENIKVAD
jgi:hypothetical protein